jgi:CubicO group peptidase (beta-lactamase class C family)
MKLFNKKRVVIGLIVVFVLLALGGYRYREYFQQLPIGVAFKSKILCSAVFISGRDPELIQKEDIGFNPLFKIVLPTIDRTEKSVTCSLLGTGLLKKKAVYTEQLGSVLLSGRAEKTIRDWKPKPPSPEPPEPAIVDWPMGDRLPEGPLSGNIDIKKISATADTIFTESNPKKKLNTRALLIVYDGRLIFESYGPQITRETPLISWSMAKSFTNAMVGILKMKGKISLNDPAPVPEWQKAGDPRKAVTLDQLLRMSSGLEWVEAYEEKPVSDVNSMLFLEPDMAAFAASKPLAAQPDQVWYYSSGTSNLIQRILRDSIGNQEAYWEFPRRELFNKIGMRSAVWETDASGTFVGSSYLYATARDFARFGLLYLNDGVWQGQRILPAGWVAYTTTPTPGSPKGKYGAHFWLNGGLKSEPSKRPYPQLPGDAYFARGYQGQTIAMIPSRKLVIVRLGMTYDDQWRMEPFIKNILEAIKAE